MLGVPLLAACGSGSHDGSTSAKETSSNPAARVSSSAHGTPVERELAGCAGAVVGTFVQVGEHVNHEAMYGGNAQQAARRVSGSSALASAISSRDRAALERALRGVLAGQIVRIEIVEHGKVLASVGSGSAIAP